MSKLYGYLTNERDGVSTRAAHREIVADVQTEYARISVVLMPDGEYRIVVKRGDRASGYSERTAVVSGNAHADHPIRYVNGDVREIESRDGRFVHILRLDGTVESRERAS